MFIEQTNYIWHSVNKYMHSLISSVDLIQFVDILYAWHDVIYWDFNWVARIPDFTLFLAQLCQASPDSYTPSLGDVKYLSPLWSISYYFLLRHWSSALVAVVVVKLYALAGFYVCEYQRKMSL